jgi:WD40 repeat protein
VLDPILLTAAHQGLHSSFMQTDEACPAGRPIECAVEAQTARLIASCWSEPSRRRQLLGHKGRVFDFQYHSSESRALSCSEDGTVRIWNMTQGISEGSALKGSKDEVSYIEFIVVLQLTFSVLSAPQSRAEEQCC